MRNVVTNFYLISHLMYASYVLQIFYQIVEIIYLLRQLIEKISVKIHNFVVVRQTQKINYRYKASEKPLEYFKSIFNVYCEF